MQEDWQTYRQIMQETTYLKVQRSCARGLTNRQRWIKTTLVSSPYLRVQWSCTRGQTDRQTDRLMIQDYPFMLCKRTDRQMKQDYPYSRLTWEFNEVVQKDRQTNRQMMKLFQRTDRQTDRQMNQDYPFSSGYLRVQWSCAEGQTDRQTDRWTKTTLFPVVTWEFNQVVQKDRQTDRQTDKWTKTTLFPVVTWEFNEVVQKDRQTNRQMNQVYPFSSGYLRVQWSCAEGQTDKQTDEPRLPFFQWLPESSMKLCRRTDRQMIQDCPTSSPLTPDRMLMALVQNTASMPMYT